MSRGNKSQIIVYEQTREVYNYMLNQSKQRKDIIRFFVDKWSKNGVFDENVTIVSKHRTIDNYIKKARQSFFNFESEVSTEKGRNLARLDDLYSKCYKEKDYKGALVMLKEINEMLDLKGSIQKDKETSKIEKVVIEVINDSKS